MPPAHIWVGTFCVISHLSTVIYPLKLNSQIESMVSRKLMMKSVGALNVMQTMLTLVLLSSVMHMCWCTMQVFTLLHWSAVGGGNKQAYCEIKTDESSVSWQKYKDLFSKKEKKLPNNTVYSLNTSVVQMCVNTDKLYSIRYWCVSLGV